MKKYSDLVIEQIAENGKLPENGDSIVTKGLYGYICEEYTINSVNIAKKYKKPMGKYSLLTLKNIFNAEEKVEKYYLKQLIEKLKSYINIDKNSTILIAGLGNRHISSDSLGAEVVKNIIITRNFIRNVPQVCAIAPSVMGLTGIETADIINGVVQKVKPDLLVLIDSLCASDVKRLGVSFQITNTAIIPGSGINNTRKAINSKTKILSIGVPLVVYSNTYIKTALDSSGIEIDSIKDINLRNQLKSLVREETNELVTLSEIEYAVKTIAKFIAKALNTLFL